jgi:hypothetical protein
LFGETLAGIADYSEGCGDHVYKLNGGDTNYLKFNEATRELTLHTMDPVDVGVPYPTLNEVIPSKTHTIRAYGSKWDVDYEEVSFTVTILPCNLIPKPIDAKTVSLG